MFVSVILFFDIFFYIKIYCFRINRGKEENLLPPADFKFDIKFETDLKAAYRMIQAALIVYKDEKRGPTLLSVQSQKGY